ncbi:MAG: GNAT family N-acetyltransferase [Oscillospiraceae bacterium]|nr:GNAT family N-acetyltransferase [Oscillospiraceae bacterium]
MLHQLKARLGEDGLEPITACNYEPYMEVYATNPAFGSLSGGEEVSREGVLDDITRVPPGFDIKDKHFLGLRKNGAAAGVLDVLAGYPEKHCVWIGLLMIRGDLHNRQIGSETVKALLCAAKDEGFTSVQLGVLENNPHGQRFWQKFGFSKIREAPAEQNGINVIVMEKRI